MKFLLPLSIIFFAVILRLIPHPANFAPIGALALFGGMYLNKKFALIIPILVMFVSDLFLGFHSTIPFVYGSFLVSGVIGIWIGKRRNFNRFVLGTLISSIVFFAITNFGVWLTTSMYPRNIGGIINCYTFAIPFFRNTILSDFFYLGLFASSYELAIRFLSSKMALLRHESR